MDHRPPCALPTEQVLCKSLEYILTIHDNSNPVTGVQHMQNIQNCSELLLIVGLWLPLWH